jgi:Ca2+-binding EF-hand superfamily protein
MSDDQLRTAWQIFDKNGTGMITVDEVGEVMRACGLTPTEKEASEWSQSVADADGNVSWEGFNYIKNNWRQDDDNTARAMLTEYVYFFDNIFFFNDDLLVA